MGATTFYELSRANTAEEAFSLAKKDAQYIHGHGGYTGTIAEKSTYSMASKLPLAKAEAYNLARSLSDTLFSDKWGPAGCIEIIPESENQANKLFLFFGWASE